MAGSPPLYKRDGNLEFTKYSCVLRLNFTRSLNVFYFQMDGYNLKQIEHHQKIKNRLLFFFIFNFTCCKIFALKENNYDKQTYHPQGFPQGEIGCRTQRGKWGGWDLPASLKVSTFPFCWIKISHIGKFHLLGKKSISNSFQISFNKNFGCSIHSVTQL